MKRVIQAGKAHDSRVRRWARRLGLRLEKSRCRRATYYDHGLYMLMLTDRNSVVAGDRFTARLEDIEAYLAAEEKRRAGD